MAKLTRKEIVSMPRDKFLRLMADPTTRKEIEDVWNAGTVEAEVPPVVEEPPAEKTAEELATEQAEADRLAAEKAETDRLAAEKVEADRLVAEAAKKKEKIVVQYQARDEQGNPIGNPTHLEADSWEEMSKKQQDAHVNAVRAIARLKARQVTQKKVEEPKPGMSDEEIEAAVQQIREDDPKVAATAVRKLTGADELDAERQRLREKEVALEAQRVSHEFMRRHLQDFNPCEANAQIIGKYITDNNLEWTVDNLEHAFEQVELQLAVPNAPAPKPEPVVPANTETVAPTVAPAQPVAPVAPAPTVPPVVAADPAPVVAPAPIAPEPARRVPSSGIVPGTTAGRPGVRVSPGLTKQDIAKMEPAKLKILMRDPKQRAEINRIINLPQGQNS